MIVQYQQHIQCPLKKSESDVGFAQLKCRRKLLICFNFLKISQYFIFLRFIFDGLLLIISSLCVIAITRNWWNTIGLFTFSGCHGYCVGNIFPVSSSLGTDHDTEAEKQLEDAEDDSKDMGASLVIGCLLIIPVIIIVAATIFVRIRKTGKKLYYRCLLWPET